MEKIDLKEYVILVDADYADTVAQGFTQHFSERMGRTLPPVDLALWLVCCALDAGISHGDNQLQVIFVHSAGKSGMQYFVPADFTKDLDGTAFRDPNLGEFLLSSVPDEEINCGEPLITQCVRAVLSDKKVKTLAVVAAPSSCQMPKEVIEASTSQDAHFLISMGGEPVDGFMAINMGYSLMHALHIDASEL